MTEAPVVTPEVTPDGGIAGLVTAGGGPVGGSIASLTIGALALILATIGAAGLASAHLRRRGHGRELPEAR